MLKIFLTFKTNSGFRFNLDNIFQSNIYIYIYIYHACISDIEIYIYRQNDYLF